MTGLGPFELNIIKRKIIDKLYFFSPRLVSLEKLRVAVDNPEQEGFQSAISYLIKEGIVTESSEGYTLTEEGTSIFEDRSKFEEYFPLADVPRTSFG